MTPDIPPLIKKFTILLLVPGQRIDLFLRNLRIAFLVQHYRLFTQQHLFLRVILIKHELILSKPQLQPFFQTVHRLQTFKPVLSFKNRKSQIFLHSPARKAQTIQFPVLPIETVKHVVSGRRRMMAANRALQKDLADDVAGSEGDQRHGVRGDHPGLGGLVGNGVERL